MSGLLYVPHLPAGKVPGRIVRDGGSLEPVSRSRREVASACSGRRAPSRESPRRASETIRCGSVTTVLQSVALSASFGLVEPIMGH